MRWENGKLQVVESYHWGFAALGHACTRRINSIDPEAVNIVFGTAIPIQLGLIETFPANTIFVNLERYSHRDLAGTTVEYVASRYQIWEYSRQNLVAWHKIRTRFPVYLAPISYAPNLEKIPRDVVQDIDVLYYGKLLPDRIDVLNEIASTKRDMSGMSLITMTNVWGAHRDEFIARAKVIANPSLGQIFEIVRVSYLLANRKAIVSTVAEDIEIDADLKDVLCIAKQNEILDECEALVLDPEKRAAYAEQCYTTFKQRDVRKVIQDFFA